MSHPQDLGLREQASMIASGELDAGELLDSTLARIEERDGPLNSIVARFPDQSKRMLAAAPRGPLHGVPVAVKDMFQHLTPASDLEFRHSFNAPTCRIEGMTIAGS